jgi:hypothetical protein
MKSRTKLLQCKAGAIEANFALSVAQMNDLLWGKVHQDAVISSGESILTHILLLVMNINLQIRARAESDRVRGVERLWHGKIFWACLTCQGRHTYASFVNDQPQTLIS